MQHLLRRESQIDPRIFTDDHNQSTKSAIHYHIRWSGSSLDWKAFPTKEEATILADQIKKRNESFTVVERDNECEQCKMFRSKPIKVKSQKDFVG
jgi:hypothetical protein